jgi:hypothetical protein
MLLKASALKIARRERDSSGRTPKEKVFCRTNSRLGSFFHLSYCVILVFDTHSDRWVSG